MKIRSSLLVVVVSISLFLVPVTVAYQADRRTINLMGRLMRLNPFHHLVNYFGRKLNADPYESPQIRPLPHLNQQLVPGGQYQYQFKPSHYVKIPSWHQPIYYMPPLKPVSVMAMSPVLPQQYQPTYPQKYLLHGYSYSVPYLPQQQQQPSPEVVQVTQAPETILPYSQPAVVTEASVNTAIQFQQNSFTNPVSQEQSQPQEVQAPEYYSSQVQSSSSSSNSGEVQSLPAPVLPSKYDPGPSIVESAHQLNEMEIRTDNLKAIQEQLSQPSSDLESEVQITNSPNTMKIVLIKPTDLEKFKSSKEEADATAAEASDFMKGYTMKFIDLDEGAQEMIVTSQKSTGSKFEVENKPCIEPFCDPFLRKLIPELMQLTRKKEEDPLIIVKQNDDDNESSKSPNPTPIQRSHSTYLPTRNLIDNYSRAEPEVSLVRAVEETGTPDLFQDKKDDTSTAKPHLFHIPRKLISAKINASFYDNYKPKLRSSVSYKVESSVSSSSSKREKAKKRLERLRNFRTSSVTDPSSYGSGVSLREADSQQASSDNVISYSLIPRPRTFRVGKRENRPVYRRRNSRRTSTSGKAKRRMDQGDNQSVGDSTDNEAN